MFDRFVSWFYTWRVWGPRCTEYEKDCLVCRQWREHDEIFNSDTKEVINHD
jgi:hypothetical protein